MLTDTALKWLERYCISKETAEHFNLTVEEHHFPELECDRKAIRIPYVVNGTVVGSRWVDHKENWTSDLQAPHLWNTDARKAPALYICDNELAVMALHGVGISAVCPSDYCKPSQLAEVKYLHDVLSGITEACLIFSKTQESLEWEKSLSHAFASIGATTTRFHEGCSTVYQVLKKHGNKGIADIIESRTNLPPHGIKSFADYSHDIVEFYHGRKIKFYSTGFGTVDPFWKMQPGALHVFTGIPMSGKTNLLNQIIVNTIELYDWNWLVYSPESSPCPVMFQSLAEIYLRKPMFGKDRMNENEMVSAMAKINKHVRFIPPEDEEVTIDHLLSLARLACLKWTINAMIIDPMNEVIPVLESNENKTDYIGRFLAKYRNFARVNELVAFLIAHPVKLKKDERSGEYLCPTPYDVADSANFRNKADVCLALWRKFQEETNEVSLFVQKVRRRDAGRTGEIKLYWTYKTNRFEEQQMELPSAENFNPTD